MPVWTLDKTYLLHCRESNRVSSVVRPFNILPELSRLPYIYPCMYVRVCIYMNVKYVCRALLTGRAAGQLPEAPTCNRHYDVSGIIRRMVPVTLDFHTREKKFLWKLSAVWARALKKFRQPCPRLKKFQECRFECEQNCEYLPARGFPRGADKSLARLLKETSYSDQDLQHYINTYDVKTTGIYCCCLYAISLGIVL